MWRYRRRAGMNRHVGVVQRRLAYSVGGSPIRAKVRNPVAWIVGRKETEFREPIDKAIEAERLKRFSNQRRHGLNQPISAYDRGYQMPPTLGTSSRRSYTSARSTSDRFAVRTISGPEVVPVPYRSAPLMDDNVVFRPDRRMLLWTFNRLASYAQANTARISKRNTPRIPPTTTATATLLDICYLLM